MTDLASSVQAQALASDAAAADVRGADAVRTVQQATEAPGVFVFGELLDVPGVREVCRRRCAPRSPSACTGPRACERIPHAASLC